MRTLLLSSLFLFVSVQADAVDLTAMDKTARGFSNIKTVQVAHKGKLVWSKAYNKANIDAVANIKSASKSLMSAIVGMAIERGVIKGVEQSVVSILADQFPGDPDPRLSDITIGHLLSMQAGLERTSGRYYGRWVSSDNWVKEALSRPFVEAVGGNMQYSTGSTHILSAIIMRQSGQHTYQLANRWFKGSGVRIQSWEVDPQGIPMGGNQVGMTPASLLAFGELYRRGGVTEKGRRIFSKDWIEKSWQPKTQSRFHRGKYGYGWFIQTFAGVQGYYGWGYGGQMIYVLPELDLTVAITSNEYLPSGKTGYRDLLHDMVSQNIVPAIQSEM
ncbi:class C beta-lactamase-related serine hydrolase [Marinomonas rhizomae]|uniref:CubicO group peptidase (Beta-lactamase class C family) n=1 Tax=Marinomonas rhizomae TaxID=491948 RepID=A0A366JBL9_9GAMM|nr:serine hydrolase [Marinomonas rhizomae]RBP84352.1 CubicO group peptidase (beta-lactamase class C family) [Marinomonas rhizomae]RNF74668.1 class C beta-lactamase-related serine hydrolase [Marinomonas rhizomae]